MNERMTDEAVGEKKPEKNIMHVTFDKVARTNAFWNRKRNWKSLFIGKFYNRNMLINVDTISTI